MLKLGRHISVAGGLDIAFDRGEAIGCTAMQIFVSNPRSWRMAKLDGKDADKFSQRFESSSIDDVIAHMPYLPNLSSSNKQIYAAS